MRLTLCWFGYELDFSFGPTTVDDMQEPCTGEFEPYQDAGTTGCTILGFAPTPHPGWERPLNTFDEPGEGDEGV